MGSPIRFLLRFVAHWLCLAVKDVLPETSGREKVTSI
jgi:hypothetical protein